MKIRQATKNDIDSIEKIYENIHDEEEKGQAVIAWQLTHARIVKGMARHL